MIRSYQMWSYLSSVIGKYYLGKQFHKTDSALGYAIVYTISIHAVVP